MAQSQSPNLSYIQWIINYQLNITFIILIIVLNGIAKPIPKLNSRIHRKLKKFKPKKQKPNNNVQNQIQSLDLDKISKLWGIFGRVNFRERERERMRRENFLGGIWLRRGEEKEIVRARCFLPGLSKSFLPKIWRKLGGEKIRIGLTKMSVCTMHMGFVHTQCFFLPLAHTEFFC